MNMTENTHFAGLLESSKKGFKTRFELLALIFAGLNGCTGSNELTAEWEDTLWTGEPDTRPSRSVQGESTELELCLCVCVCVYLTWQKQPIV